jgi:hypothetical protein
MKNIKYYLAAILVILLASCEVNDLQPQTALSETTAFETPERIELAVAGVYDGGQSGFYLGGAVRGYPFGAAVMQQGDMRGEDMISTQLFYAITYENTYDPTTPNNGFLWQTLYAMINRANIVIEGIKKTKPSAVLTQEKLNEYEAECRFLRAIGHHFLLIHWSRPFSDNPTAPNGGVPYRTSPIGVVGGASVDEAIAQGRNTVAECYDKMIEDLDFAEANLPATRATNRITRATKAAAIAAKTRIRLHQGRWQDVITEGNKLAPQTSAPFSSPIGNYSLTASPIGAFGAGNKNNSESIFSIENNDVDNGGVNGALPTMYGSSASGARGIICISPILWNQSWWLASDLRKSATMVQDDPVASPGRGGKFTRKYADAVTRTDNSPIFRYAEVLLNLAEALARNSAGVDPKAVALLNAVRNRAVTNTADQFTVSSFATSTDLVRAILQERRIEFIGEGLRWGDIHRLARDTNFTTGGIPAKANRGISNFAPLYTNNPATTFPMQPAIPYADFRFIWPIPSEEIVNNPTLAKQQNPGW